MKTTTKNNAKSLTESVSESTTACLVTMVQGNVLALTFGHLAIAAQTGITAGLFTLAITLMARINNPWIMPLILGVTTGIVDFYMHPGSFGAEATEAIVTGVAAAGLSLLVTWLFQLFRKPQSKPSPVD